MYFTRTYYYLANADFIGRVFILTRTFESSSFLFLAAVGRYYQFLGERMDGDTKMNLTIFVFGALGKFQFRTFRAHP